MFNLRKSTRESQRQGCTSPPPGTDSAYGVRSLNGSVAWDPSARSTERSEGSDQNDQRDRRDEERPTGTPSETPGTGGSISDRAKIDETLSPRSDHPSTGTPAPALGLQGLDADATPLPNALALPDPFAPSPPPSPRTPTSPSSPVQSPSPSHPSRPSPIPVSGRIAHVGQGIMWAPSSPDETLHPLALSHTSNTSGQGLASLVHPRPATTENLSPDPMWRSDFPRTLSDLEHLDTGGVSGRSSPASFTSLPSYVGSMSSLSRASSPVSGISGAAISRETSYSATHRFAGLRHEREYSGVDAEGSRSEELVLPTLSLPSSSLHLSLAKWTGQVSAVKVVLLGEMDQTQGAIRALEGKVELVEVESGVGIVKEGEVVLVLAISSRAELVKRQVLASYAALSRLLHPHPPEGSEKQIRQMASEHARRFPWVHAVFDLSEGVLPTLSKLVPIITLDKLPPSEPVRSRSTSGDAVSPISSPLDDPTPMPGAQSATSYFPTSVDLTPSDRVALHLVDLLSRLSETEDQSIDTFLARRSRIIETSSSLEASVTSADSSAPFSARSAHSGASGTSSAQGPMPTVARANGGGEWEAGLSRRLAAHLQRKEHDRSPRDRTRARRVKKKGCVPLFPHGSSSGKVIDLNIWQSIWSRLFGPWIPPAIKDLPVVDLPGSGDKDSPIRHEVKPKKRWNMWQWGLGAVVVAGVGLWLIKPDVVLDIHIGVGI